MKRSSVWFVRAQSEKQVDDANNAPARRTHLLSVTNINEVKAFQRLSLFQNRTGGVV